MQKLLLFSLLIILFTSCESTNEYPKYSVCDIVYIPDSLKERHREYIKETIRATNQHLSAGDYENVDDVVITIKRMADNLYGIDSFGLKIQTKEYSWILVSPNKFTKEQKHIFDSLMTK